MRFIKLTSLADGRPVYINPSTTLIFYANNFGETVIIFDGDEDHAILVRETPDEVQEAFQAN